MVATFMVDEICIIANERPVHLQNKLLSLSVVYAQLQFRLLVELLCKSEHSN